MNIAGLTIGFTAFVLISLFIYCEFHWDAHNENYERIFRVQQYINTKGDIWTQVPPAMPQALKNKFPELEQSILVREAWGEYLSVNGGSVTFFDNDGYYADQNIFSVFTVDIISGSAINALTEPNSITLSEKLAKKLFGDADPLGKIITVDKVHALKVTAVYKDFPRNSHILPSYISSLGAFKTIRNWHNFLTTWESNSFRCYVLTKPGTDIEALDKKIAGIYPDNHPRKKDFKPYLRPLSRLVISPTGNDDYLRAIYTYCIIAIFILILAAINYINHTTAYATIRAKEIAVRKVNGSNRFLLMVQFLSESVLFAVISFVIALVLVTFILPFFNQLVDRQMVLDFNGAGTYFFVLFCIVILVGLLSGLYPAFFMSSSKSISLLKGDIFKAKHVRGGIRKVLVTLQFYVSIALIIMTIFMTRQINFSMNKDIGFNQDNLLIAQFKNVKDSVSFENIKDKFLKYPIILDAAVSENIPFWGSDGMVTSWEGAQAGEKEDIRYNLVDYNYIKTVGLKIIDGREFSVDMPSDYNNSCIINETAWKRFGWKDPIGKYIEKGDNTKKWIVIGVVKDFHMYSIHMKIPPLLMELDAYDKIKSWMTFSFRIQPGTEKMAKAILEKEIAGIFPNDPFEVQAFKEYKNTDQTFKNYTIIRNTFLLFAMIIIFQTIFGLFGLVSFAIQRRTKEIGIRKINGSSVWSIFYMLNKEYSYLILIATLIALPLGHYSYYVMPFPYKFHIVGWEYALATAIVFVISLLTTGYYTYRAATRNPIESLRYE
jgi:putative ABC transport system permease protein